MLHKGTNKEILVLFQRERKISPSGDFITKISESYPANESVVAQKGGREIPSRNSERAQSHHDTELDEARGKSKSRSCAVIERDDGRINHNSYSTGVIFRSGVVTRE